MSETSDRSGQVTVTAFGLTDAGRVRKNNEDAFLISQLANAAEGMMPEEVVTFDAGEHAVVLAVSDGMGGAEAGEVASALVVQSLRDAMMNAKGGDWDEATKAAVEKANRAVWDAAKEPGKKGMGATVTAVCVHKNQAHIAEVGDSRAYLIRHGRIRQMTRDQSFVQFLVDSGALKPEEAESYPMKNVVLQAMGQRADVQVALGRLELRRGDRLLLCSDGLSGMVTANDMRDTIERAKSLDEACSELITLANERGGEDNITVVLAEVGGDGLAIPRDAETLTQTFQVLAEYKAAAAGADLHDEAGDDDQDVDEGASELAPPPSSSPPVAQPNPSSKLPMLVLAVGIGLLVAMIVVLLMRR
ncbi:Protein serine/threonine phosphatase PrpC, regulation of stationary phase [Minicystis rosea]|nr:Protein serine/threonine phosphatase PrpC, regulation of stationary phase [Minicystis rosea]